MVVVFIVVGITASGQPFGFLLLLPTGFSVAGCHNYGVDKMLEADHMLLDWWVSLASQGMCHDWMVLRFNSSI